MHTITAPTDAPTETSGHRSRADKVYVQLKQDVADFKLVPGDRFTETEPGGRACVTRPGVR